MEWEYKLESHLSSGPDDHEAYLNKRGAEGWELVTMDGWGWHVWKKLK